MKDIKKLAPQIILAISLLTSWISVATFGKDNVVELIAKMVIQEVLKSQCSLDSMIVELEPRG